MKCADCVRADVFTFILLQFTRSASEILIEMTSVNVHTEDFMFYETLNTFSLSLKNKREN